MPHCRFSNYKHDRIVAVMGATGTGKSTFINLLTEDENIEIGHDPESQTDSINVSCYFDGDAGLSTTLVDTPGFDDSRDGHSDVDILKKISDFLMKDGGRKLNGIIYMHRISDPRTGGIAKKNLRMFKELCGEKTLANVVIVTTNWSRVEEAEGDKREKALKEGFFKGLLDERARIARHGDTVESARSIIAPLLQKDSVTAKIIDELHGGKKLVETSAGAVLDADMQEMESRHKREMQELKAEMEKAVREKDDELQKELEQERLEVASKLDKLQKEREKLEQEVEEQRLELQAHLARLEKAKEETDRKAKELEAVQKQLEIDAAEQRSKVETELKRVKEVAERRAADMQAAAEKEREEQSKKIAAQLARVKEEGDRKLAEMIAKQKKFEAAAAGERKESRKQLDEQREKSRQELYKAKVEAEVQKRKAETEREIQRRALEEQIKQAQKDAEHRLEMIMKDAERQQLAIERAQEEARVKGRELQRVQDAANRGIIEKVWDFIVGG